MRGHESIAFISTRCFSIGSLLGRTLWEMTSFLFGLIFCSCGCLVAFFLLCVLSFLLFCSRFHSLVEVFVLFLFRFFQQSLTCLSLSQKKKKLLTIRQCGWSRINTLSMVQKLT